jgi:suppressor for copper-sensitivity B
MAATVGEWAKADLVEARLVSAVEGMGDLRTVPLGVELRLKPGWKTYWRSPGDAGLPPTLDWSGSTNLAGATLAFPAPQRFQLFGLQTFGYGDHVVFPVAAAVAEPGRPLGLAARLDVLVCADVCVPEALDLALGVPAGPAAPAAEAQLIGRFRAQVPGDGAALGLAIEGARAVALGDRLGLEVTASAREPFTTPDVVAELDPHLGLGPPDVRLTEGGRRAVLTLTLAGDLPAGTGLAGRPVTLTLIDGARSAERATVIAEGGPAVVGGPDIGLAPLAGMVGLALLGGLILNLMPCVLPVLSLKLLSVVGHGGGSPARVRAGFLATAAGIISSFLAIAAGLVALKAAGRTVGWGIQFQEPLFIAVLLVLVTLFACNLWGFFEVLLPGRVADGAAQGGRRGGLAGEFATGALATLLATPCSAPFLGTAVGFALAGAWWQVVAIFLALGLGLALPYVAVALFPRLATSLPRPGRWMVRLRRALGFALAATAAWLLTVLAGQVGAAAAAIVGGLILAIVAALGLRHAAPAAAFGGRAGVVAATALAVAALAVPAAFDGRAGRAAAGAAADGAVGWVPFDRDRARGLVAQGRTVFVDVTADWCITCQANKRFVLDTGPMAERLAGVIAMRADWTSPDPAVSAFLASHGRYGIPFNVVYGPGEPAGVALPEILTEAAVTAALERAGRRVLAATPGQGAGPP